MSQARRVPGVAVCLNLRPLLRPGNTSVRSRPFLCLTRADARPCFAQGHAASWPPGERQRAKGENMSRPVSRTGKHSGSSSGQHAAALRAAIVVLALAALLVALALLAGCGKSVESTSSSAGTATSPAVTLQATTPAGTGTLDSMTWDLTLGEPTTLDPLKAGDYGPCFVSSQLHDTLVRYSPDWKLGPGIAESWTQPDDKTIVYAIRTEREVLGRQPGHRGRRRLQPRAATWTRSPGRSGAPSSATSRASPRPATARSRSASSKPDELFNKEMGTSARRHRREGVRREGRRRQVRLRHEGHGQRPVQDHELEAGQEIVLQANPDYWDPALPPKVAT